MSGSVVDEPPVSIFAARCWNQSPRLIVGATSVPVVSHGGENKE